MTKRLTYRPLSLYSLVIRAGRLKLLVCVSLCHGCQKRLFLGGYFFFLRELTHGGWHRQTHREVASVLYCNMKGEETQCSSSTWHYLALTCRYSSQTFCDLQTILTMYKSEPAEQGLWSLHGAAALWHFAELVFSLSKAYSHSCCSVPELWNSVFYIFTFQSVFLRSRALLNDTFITKQRATFHSCVLKIALLNSQNLKIEYIWICRHHFWSSQGGATCLKNEI